MRCQRYARRRAGFGMLEVVILLGIASVVGVLSAMVVVEAGRMRRVQDTALILDRTRLAIFDVAATNKAFRQRVFALPRLLSQLSSPIATGDPNSCTSGADQTLSTGERNAWFDWGPFGGHAINAAVGLVTPIGIGDNTMVRAPTNGVAGTLTIVFPIVDVVDVTLLDQTFDNADGFNLGAVRWTSPGAADGTTNMNYQITIDGTC